MGVRELARRLCPRLGAFLTLLALGALAQGTAEAGCAHPEHAPKGPGAPAGFERLFRAGGLPAAPLAPLPCSGPTCSRGTSTPLTTAPATPPGVEPWGLLAIGGQEAPPASAAFPSEDPPAYPSQSAPAIFHPPRTSPRSR